MPKNHLYTFADILARQSIRVKCQRCPRAGRYRLDKLVAKYGVDTPLTVWTEEISADCPMRGHWDMTRRCFGPSCPDLPEILHGKRARAEDEERSKPDVRTRQKRT